MSDIQKITKPSALVVMANKFSVEPLKLMETLKATVFKGASNEELLALVVVANEYQLNPFLREIYAFPGKKGGIVPIVPIDGWTRIVNRQEKFDGVDFAWVFDETSKKPVSCTCTIYVRDRSRPIVVTEFYDECYRNSEPWNMMPKRMLRHKAFMQTARVAFGLSGVYDEDEGKDQAVAGVDIPVATGGTKAIDVTIVEPPTQTPEPTPTSDARTPQDELANIIIEAGHSFDAFAKWGRKEFTAMKWDNINSFEEVPKADALRFIRASGGLLKELDKSKESLAL